MDPTVSETEESVRDRPKSTGWFVLVAEVSVEDFKDTVVSVEVVVDVLAPVEVAVVVVAVVVVVCVAEVLEEEEVVDVDVVVVEVVVVVALPEVDITGRSSRTPLLGP